ncbi:MAG: portal protein [Candidatus Thermoplasmatota archaeon]
MAADTTSEAPKEATNKSAYEKRKGYLKRLAALKNERSSWDSHWTEVAEHFYPRGQRLLSTQKNYGGKMNSAIINETPLTSLDTLAAGMMSGITPRSRPWFRLTTPDPRLAEYGAVKEWLHTVEERIRTAIDKSNAYLAFHQIYMGLGSFGTSVCRVEPDEEDGLRCYVVPVGRFCVANSARLRVDTLYDELSMTVAQLVEQFGLDACSKPVKELWEKGDRDSWIDVVHVNEPNKAKVEGAIGPKGMAWTSCWFEASANIETGFLRESGSEEFGVVAPRWLLTGEDVYGNAPAMNGLGPAKALQLAEKREAQAFDRIVNPPMVAPVSLQGMGVSLVPGATNYVDNVSNQVVRPAVEPHPQALNAAEAKIQRLERSVRSVMYADVWLMMQRGENDPQKTATEITALKEEKMQQLGPVTERLQDELLDPFIDRVFAILLRANRIPLPPKELQGQPLRVEYLGVMAQAQKVLGVVAVDRTVGFIGQLAQLQAANGRAPEVLDKLDFDKAVTEHAQMTGIPPALIRTDEDVAATRGQRAQQAAQQQQMQQAAQMAEVAKNAAQAVGQPAAEGGGALGELLGTMGAPGGRLQ